jgi:hypothetical protein
MEALGRKLSGSKLLDRRSSILNTA